MLVDFGSAKAVATLNLTMPSVPDDWKINDVTVSLSLGSDTADGVAWWTTLRDHSAVIKDTTSTGSTVSSALAARCWLHNAAAC